MSDNTEASRAVDFIERLKELRFRKKLAPKLHAVEEGDWEAVVQIAAAEGYEFSKQELKQAVPPGFYREFRPGRSERGEGREDRGAREGSEAREGTEAREGRDDPGRQESRREQLRSRRWSQQSLEK